MSAPASCPDRAVLEAFAADTVPAAERLVLDGHIWTCEPCAAQIDALLAPIAAALRTPSFSTAPTLLSPSLLRCIHRRFPSPDRAAPYAVPTLASLNLPPLGKYHPVEVLGAGGMGAVVRAREVGLERDVALKVLLPLLAKEQQAHDRFMREVRALACLESDHVVTVYAGGVVELRDGLAQPYLVMPLLAGETVATRLSRSAPLPLRAALRIIYQTLLGLKAAHAVGLIHRDIKPANLWLEARPDLPDRIRILDFGLVRIKDTTPDSVSASGQFIGTPRYMAPEQARGENETLDGRADLFSVGVVAYELLTGLSPFTAKNHNAILQQIETHQPPPPHAINSAVTPAVGEFVMTLLHKERDHRPATATAALATVRWLK
ncbi:MAG: serine/threonine-protein kinase, partial [Alsobacter sp.]